MDATTRQTEVNRYVEATANTKLVSEDLARSLFGFTREVLNLIRPMWPKEAGEWLTCPSADNDAGQRLRQIASYRTSVLCESYRADSNHSHEAALTFLFQLALQVPDFKTTGTAGLTSMQWASLARFLDEFCVEFIEHFGHVDDVLLVLRRHFKFEFPE